jgi:hypothetical protein
MFRRNRGTRGVRNTAAEVIASWLAGARLNESSTGQLGKRRHSRWSWRRKLTVRADDRQFRAHAFDLSKGGMGLIMPRGLKVGATILIRGGHGSPWIEARVVYVVGPNDRGLFRTGVEFATPEPQGVARDD